MYYSYVFHNLAINQYRLSLESFTILILLNKKVSITLLNYKPYISFSYSFQFQIHAIILHSFNNYIVILYPYTDNTIKAHFPSCTKAII